MNRRGKKAERRSRVNEGVERECPDDRMTKNGKQK